MTHSSVKPPSMSSSSSLSRALSIGFAAASAMVMLFAPAPADSATTMNGEEVIVAAHEIIEDDLIVWGTYVRIDGIVRGDLVALGTDIVVEGVVEGDLFAVGKTVYLNGAVHDDTRIAAYATALGERASTSDDCFVLAYSLEAKPPSQIGGTLWAAAGQALLAGRVTESLALRTGALTLTGLTAGDVSAVVGGLDGFDHSELVIDLAIDIPDVADGLLVATGAHIGGDLDYRAETAAQIEPGAMIAGETRREPWGAGPLALPTAEEPADQPSAWRDAMDDFLLLALVGFAVLAAAPRWAQLQASETRAETVQAFAWGVGSIIAIGLVSFALGVVGLMSLVAAVSSGGATALGITVAIFFLQAALLAPFALALLYLSPVLACIAIGGAALARAGRISVGDSFRDGIAPMLAGCALYSALCAVPILGVLVAILGTLAGLGAIAQSLDDVRRQQAGSELDSPSPEPIGAVHGGA
jgi:hypothetical protein